MFAVSQGWCVLGQCIADNIRLLLTVFQEDAEIPPRRPAPLADTCQI